MAGESGCLADVAEVIMGQSPPGEFVNNSGEGLPLLNGPTEFTSSHPIPTQYTTDVRKHALPGDILFCVRGSTTGRMNWADQEYAIGRGLAAIRPKVPGTATAVRAIIEVALRRLLPAATGSTFPNVSRSQLMQIPCPSKDGKGLIGIANVLHPIEAKLDINRRLVDTLDAQARTIFRNWFVDFGPVQAKANDRLTGLPDDLSNLFPAQFDVDGLPEGWQKQPLRPLINIVKGNSYRSADLATSRTALVTLKSFKRGGGYRPDGLKSFTGTYKPGQVVHAGELVVAGTDVTQAAEIVGQPALVRSDPAYDTLVASLDTFIVRPKTHKPWLWELFLREQGFPQFAKGYTTGTTVLHLSSSVFTDFHVILPPSAELLVAAEQALEPFVNRREALPIQSLALDTLRRTLLPKLISGELRVKDVEALVGAVA